MWQPPSLQDMQALLPQYHFESLLGRGGMGAVYKAVQISLDRPVAIKVLPGDLIDDSDAQFAERFKNEARTMAKMNHPSIVNVYDFGETRSGLLFIVMEFIDGTDVSKMIISQGKLPEEYALSITAHVCDALNYAHRNGVIHRDIKPANILINMEGAVKVADFGLAKQNDAGAGGLTKTNMAMGTPDFVAPEALMPGVPLDGRADLYAIGVMLYQMLTGEIPRGMWTMPGLKLGTDPRFDAIIAKAMQTDRESRYQSAAEIRKDLDSILTIPRLHTQPQPATSSSPASQPAQKPASQGPREPQGKRPHEKPLPQSQSSSAPKKSSLGLIVGLAAASALAVGGYVLLTPPAAKTSTPVSADAFAGEVASLSPEQQVEQVRQRIMQLNKGEDVKLKPVFKNGSVESLDLNRTGDVTDLSPIAALKNLKGFASYYMGVTDFRFLRGLPLERLVIMQSKVTDLSMLQGMPLRQVRLVNTYATDLHALADSPVDDLTVNMSQISDLSFVRKMPLRILNIEKTKVRNLSPVKGMPIESLTCETEVAADLSNRDTLRSLTRLKLINGTPVADFWKNIDAVSVPPPVRVPVQTIDLLALTDPVKDRVSVPGLIDKNQWNREGAALVFVPDGKSGKLAAPVALHCSDYEMEFVADKHSGNDRIHVDIPLKNGRILPLVLNAPGRKVIHEREGLDWGGSSSASIHLSIRVIDRAGALDRIIVERKVPNVKRLADWTGDFDKLAKAGEDHPSFPKQPVASVFVVRDKYEIRTWTLRVFEGSARILRGGASQPSQPAPVTPPVAVVAPAQPAAPMPVPTTPAPAPAPGPASVAPPTAQPADPVSLKLADLEAKFQIAFDRDAGSAYKAQLATLNSGYSAALDRALAAASKAGVLKDVLALREEKQRIAEGKALPPEDLDTLPDSLKKLRATWRGSESGFARARDTKGLPLFDTYDKALESFQTELTRQNKIEDALRVKTARDDLASRRGATIPPPEDKPAPPKSGKSAPASVVGAGEASSSWRKAAEWVLSLGGEVRIRDTEGRDSSVKDSGGLPAGRFDIIGITVDMAPAKGGKVTDDDLSRLNGLRTIESVRLAHLTSLTGSGFAAFTASAESMRMFAIYNSPLQPQHMGFITQFKNLRTLELNRVNSLPAESLAQIKGFKELTQLRLLGQMNVTDKVLLELSGLVRLTDLSLPGVLVSDEGLAALKGMKALLSVDLSACKGVTGSGFTHLAGAKDLVRIRLDHSGTTDIGLMHLSVLPALREINLHQTAITDDGIRHLALLKELQLLEIGAKGITGSTLQMLNSCKNLARLDLYERGAPNVTSLDDAGLQSLASAALPKLNEIAFARTSVTDAGLASLSALKLTKLRINEPPGPEGLRHIAALSTLESLEINAGALTDDGLAILAAMKSLKSLSILSSQITDAGLKPLHDMKSLKALTLRDSKTSLAGRDALAKARPDLKVGI
ncbi:protein kinase domain-containing protein [Prosthecobacter sp.]|uniref:protein kinase domain-containing protein n=1 Tax=Prosthecobacter sp. TaxID=1965333 RepID=UPI00378526D5